MALPLSMRIGWRVRLWVQGSLGLSVTCQLKEEDYIQGLVQSAINNVEFVCMQMLLALMDEAYTGSTIGDGGGDSESEDSNTIDVADSLFLDLLKDENDGLAVCSLLMSQFSFCIFWSIS